MSFLLGVVIFVLALLISVMLHETGHFVTAKKFHMKVTQYFVGFGQTLWSRQRGETEYGVKALPLGGFVKIIGMTHLEEVDPADEPRSFRRQPGWQRAIVLVAGSFMHFALAFVLLFLLAVGIGVPEHQLHDRRDQQVPAPDGQGSGRGRPARRAGPASPAALAGLRASDKVLSDRGASGAATGRSSATSSRPSRPASRSAVVVDRGGRRPDAVGHAGHGRRRHGLLPRHRGP